MAARYLIRFDDICPTMNWDVWERIERLLDFHGVKPLVSIVPDNRDKKLCVDEPNVAFWNRVRDWQTKGWTIGLHGYQHLYETQSAGIVGVNGYSEFAGLSWECQRQKIEMSFGILRREGVRSRVWIAPAHSFDTTTLDILKEFGFEVVSDGMYVRPVRDRLGMIWIPQQMWQFRAMPCGTWTVCYHHNGWRDNQLARLERDLQRFRKHVVTVEDVLCSEKIEARCVWDVAVSKIMLMGIRGRRAWRRRR